MSSKEKTTIEVSLLFREFLDYLVRIGYSDSVQNILEGVFQRAFLMNGLNF